MVLKFSSGYIEPVSRANPWRSQTLAAISAVTAHVFKDNGDHRLRYLVISIGTGTPMIEQEHNAKQASKWGVLGWLSDGGSTPLIDAFSRGIADSTNYYTSIIFQCTQSRNNYLRIQDNTLSGVASSVDGSTKENLENLVEIGQTLLQKPVSRVNLKTGIFEPVTNGGTNQEALKR